MKGLSLPISPFNRSPHERVHRYGVKDCTWESAESFANDSTKIQEFLDWWETENPKVDVKSLDPKETILIREAYNYARIGMSWPGA
jgi:hypothetical protein